MKRLVERLRRLFRIGSAGDTSTNSPENRHTARALRDRQDQIRAEEQARLRQYPTGGGFM
jgi:hypothetical protein